MKGAVTALALCFLCPSAGLLAQPVQLGASAGVLPSRQNPYKGAVRFGLGPETISSVVASVHAKKKLAAPVPLAAGLRFSFLTQKLMESQADPDFPVSYGTRSDLRVLTGEILLLYRFPVSDGLSVNAGFTAGLARIALRDRIDDLEGARSANTLTLAPVAEVQVRLGGPFLLSAMGFYKFLEADVQRERDQTVPVELTGVGFSLGLVVEVW